MRMFKKVAAMIMAVAMLCSFTALGAEVTLNDIADVTNATGAPTVVVGHDATSGIEVTVLAYEGTELAGANLVYIDQTAAGSDIEFALDAEGPFGTYTVAMGGTDVPTAATKTFNYTDATPKFDVSIAEAINGTVGTDDVCEDLKAGAEVELEIVPFLGYELSSLMVGGEEKVSAVVDGKYTVVVADADVEVVATFTAIAQEEEGKSVTYPTMFDIGAEVSDDNAPGQAAAESKLTFGQAQEIADATITSMGMYVEVKNGETWEGFKTTGDQEYGPKFPAAKWTTDMKYGIRFFSFPEGTYRISSYVDYSNGTSKSGAAIEFTVE